jgi:hypothetical protein
MDWTISDDDGVVDRFESLREAMNALASGGYPSDCEIRWVKDPGNLDNDLSWTV